MKYQWAALLILAAGIALVNPKAESGMNDDWSFIHTAKDLAASGHLRYNGWSAPLIGFQAYWAALFIKLFGFSFLITRASLWLIAALCIPVLWQLLRSVDLTEAQSFAGLILFLFSPLVLPNLTTFMTDMPAFFLFSASLLCALKAWSSASDSKAMLWVIAATVLGILSGSVRQFYWLAAVCLLAVLALTRFRSMRNRIAMAVCIAFIIGFGAMASNWLAHQPYVPSASTVQALRDMSWGNIGRASIIDMLRNFAGLAVLCLPVTLPLGWIASRTWPKWFKLLLLIIPVACLFIPLPDPLPTPWLGNTLTCYGVIYDGTVTMGEKPVVLLPKLMIFLVVCGLQAAIVALVQVKRQVQTLRWSDSGLARFSALTLPFLLLYSLILAFRAPVFGLYDRYMIPVLFVALAIALSMLAKQSQNINRLTRAVGAVFVCYALATTHDYFAETRAKLQATEQVLRDGNPRNAVMSGFEFDSWTQIDRRGYVNNGLVKFPPNSFQEIDDCTGPDDSLEWWRPYEPDMAARYVVTLSHLQGLQQSKYKPVEFRRWLPFGNYRMYVETIGTNDPLLTCKPDNGSEPEIKN